MISVPFFGVFLIAVGMMTLWKQEVRYSKMKILKGREARIAGYLVIFTGVIAIVASLASLTLFELLQTVR